MVFLFFPPTFLSLDGRGLSRAHKVEKIFFLGGGGGGGLSNGFGAEDGLRWCRFQSEDLDYQGPQVEKILLEGFIKWLWCRENGAKLVSVSNERLSSCLLRIYFYFFPLLRLYATRWVMTDSVCYVSKQLGIEHVGEQLRTLYLLYTKTLLSSMGDTIALSSFSKNPFQRK